MALAKRVKAERFPEAGGVDLEMVSEAYERGGSEGVRVDLGLEDYTPTALHRLIAHALDQYPVPFERQKVVEGVHTGLAAEALRDALLSPVPEIRFKGAEMLMKQEGLLADQRDTAQSALEALTEVVRVLAGKSEHPNVKIVELDESQVVDVEALEFPKPRGRD